MVRRYDAVHDPRKGRRGIDSGVAAAGGDHPIENDVSIEDASHLVGDGLIHVAPLDQNRVDGRDGTTGALARSLEETRKHREHTRGISTPCGSLPSRKADLALRTCKARHRIDEKHDAHSLIAKVLRIGRRDLRGTQALERSDIARGYDDDAASNPRLPEGVLEELTNLTASLADQRDDNGVSRDATRDRTEERALAHT
jgi:hypothetical protein